MTDGNTTVAVLGTGIMGAPMARHLAKAGMEVRAWNRSREKAESLAEEGIEVANSPSGAAEGAEVVITMLANADAVANVLDVEGGPLSTLAGDGLWLQMSTVGIEGHERLSGIAAEHGVAYVDAPVLGTRQPAERGELLVLASGPEEIRERCERVFDAVGGKTLWVGPAGAGSRLKLVTNNWIAGLLGTLAETIALAGATGVDPAMFLQAIEGGPLNAPYAQVKGKMMIEEDFPTSFSVRLARKDAGLILDAAESGELRLALTEAVAAYYDEAIEAGYAEQDMSAIYEAVRGNRGQRGLSE
jgi:3-hydroxyisobutyrate dehydrogenase